MKNIYIHLEDLNEELLYHLKNILEPSKSCKIKPDCFLMSVDDYIEINEIIKTIEQDFYVDIPCFIDEINIPESFNEYIYNFISSKTSGIYNLVNLIEDGVLRNDILLKQSFKKYFETKLSQETIETGLGFIKYGNSITASKELYIHRNTLNYRIDNIKKITSLDIKKFNDQLAFYGLFK